MTKKDLAQKINVHPKTLTNWEKDKPELMRLIQLGLAAEEHLKDTEIYIKKMKNICNTEKIKKGI
jgi:DNA-binding XRE family transcriptional regulator